MENQQQTTTLCRAGCGFFGSPSTEGLCSKCYKDYVKRRQDTSARVSPTMPAVVVTNATGTSSSSSLSSITSNNSGITVAAAAATAATTTATAPATSSSTISNSTTGCATVPDNTAATTSTVMIAEKLREVSCSQAAKSSEDMTAQMESAAASVEAASIAASSSATSSGALSTSSSLASLDTSTGPAEGINVNNEGQPITKKANRCHVCKKRVGLTGFVCRCGGLYCGEHRYDTAHGCSFDYKTMEREEIRKNNPVIVSEKIQRI